MGGVSTDQGEGPFNVIVIFAETPMESVAENGNYNFNEAFKKFDILKSKLRRFTKSNDIA